MQSIIGYAHTVDTVGRREAFIWNVVHGMRNLKQVLEAEHGLDLAAWTPTRANAKSAVGGVIVGDGVNCGASRVGVLDADRAIGNNVSVLI